MSSRRKNTGHGSNLIASLEKQDRVDARRRREKSAQIAREDAAGKAAVARGLRGPAASAAALAGALFAGLPVGTPGRERVAECKFCGVKSTADVRGLDRWCVQNGQDVCPACAPAAVELPAKMKQLAALVAEKKPTPEQVRELCKSVAAETGFPVVLVRHAFDTALEEARKLNAR